MQKYAEACFLCDAINLQQSVEDTLNVLGQSLKAVLDEVHFILNLYSSPLTPFFQAKLCISLVHIFMCISIVHIFPSTLSYS